MVFLCALLLLVGCCLPVCAAQEEFPLICDSAELLTDEECLQMQVRAQRISELYQCAVYVITVDDYRDYGSGSIDAVAQSLYQKYDLGWGEERSGVMLMLSMCERDYTIIAYGYGNTAFTDYGKDYLSEQFLDNFADDDWAGGCEDYLAVCGNMLKMAREGEPLTIRSRVKTWHVVLISLLLGFVIAYAVCGAWRNACKKKTAVRAEASGYLAPGGIQITLRDDAYSHTTQTRTKIERESTSSSGGTTINSDGFSSKSGKF